MSIQEVAAEKKAGINQRNVIINIKRIEKNRRSKNRKNLKDIDQVVIHMKNERKSVRDLDLNKLDSKDMKKKKNRKSLASKSNPFKLTVFIRLKF